MWLVNSGDAKFERSHFSHPLFLQYFISTIALAIIKVKLTQEIDGYLEMR